MKTAGAAVVLASVLASSAPGAQTGPPAATARRQAVEPAARTLAPQPEIPDIHMTDAGGRSVSLREALGADRAVYVNFIFTSCTTICPLMSAGFSQFQARLGAEREHVRLVSISINPETDTAEVLAGYARRYNAGPSWLFLTGTPADVEAIERAFGAYRGDPVNHEPVTYMRPQGPGTWVALDGFSSVDRLFRTLQPAAAGSRF